VLGHLLFVAVVSYFTSIEIEAGPRRAYNNFFGGLFHDLPEVLTRDIVSPVKASVEGLDELIHRYERQAMEERVFPLLPKLWGDELRYYTEEEFTNKTWQEDRVDPIQPLEDGKRSLYERYSRTVLYGYPIGQLFDLFR
jgi:putative hydrolase of HD superfamily